MAILGQYGQPMSIQLQKLAIICGKASAYTDSYEAFHM